MKPSTILLYLVVIVTIEETWTNSKHRSPDFLYNCTVDVSYNASITMTLRSYLSSKYPSSNILHLLKSYQKCVSLIIGLTLEISFLQTCRREHLTPKFCDFLLPINSSRSTKVFIPQQKTSRSSFLEIPNFTFSPE